MAKRKKRIKYFRDGYGRFTTKENAAAIKSIIKERIFRKDRKTGKIKRIKPTPIEATRLIKSKRIKETETGRKMLPSLEKDIEYYMERNPRLKLQITGAGNKNPVTLSGKKAMHYLETQLKKVWRKVREQSKEKRPYPSQLFYTRQTFAGTQIPFRIKIDFNEAVTYEGIGIYKPITIFDDSEPDEMEFDESIREAPEPVRKKKKSKKHNRKK